MGKKRKNIETAFEITVPVPQFVLNGMHNWVQEYIGDMFGVSLSMHDIATNETLQAAIIKGITEEITRSATEVEAYTIESADFNLEKIFKVQIKAHEDAEAAEEAKREAIAKEAAEQMRKNGATLKINTKQLAKAKRLLIAAGIKVVDDPIFIKMDTFE